MGLLLLVTLIWAFSFGLIGSRLAGLDSTAVATVRLGLAFLVFLPFLRLSALSWGSRFRLAGIGALQFGLMYLLYQRSFAYLPSYAVVLFTLPMPLYIAGFGALAEGSLGPRTIAAALLAVAGAGAIVAQGPLAGQWAHGSLLVQGSNLCFAAGQIAWRRERRRIDPTRSDASLFALPYAGALALAAASSFATTDWAKFQPTVGQGLVLAYLGVVSSGVCFFWWNRGATQVTTGTLAVCNNAKVPLGVACSLLFFHEAASLSRLALGAAIWGAALFLSAARPPDNPQRRVA